MKINKTTRFMLFACLLASLTMTGCSSIKQSMNNQSLDYTHTKKLAPIKLPANAQTTTFSPLYQVPEAGTNTLKLQNSKGKRYQLPKPYTETKAN